MCKALGFLEGIKFWDGGRLVTGYDAQILPYICKFYYDASKAGVLTKTQLPTALICETLTQAFSIVAITALIYEGLGFEKYKHPQAFRMLVESYMSKEARKWAKEFPDEFFLQLDRICGKQKTASTNRPQNYAKFIRKYIYDPLERGVVLKELDKKNPTNEKGNRSKRHHPFLSEEIGLPAVKAQIWQVIATLKISTNKRKFENNYKKMMGQSYQVDLFEDIDWK